MITRALCQNPAHKPFFLTAKVSECPAELVASHSPTAMVIGFFIYLGLVVVFLVVSFWLVHTFAYKHSSRKAHDVMPVEIIEPVRIPP